MSLAILLSAILIVGAYVLARGIGPTSLAEASTETALLKALAAKDSDGDGLPDWEEVLYGTDPKVVDSNKLGMTDGEAVAKGLVVPKAIQDISVDTTPPPSDGTIDYHAAGVTPPADNSLTDAFAKNFFTLYTFAKESNNGVDLTREQTNALAEQAIELLAQSVGTKRDFKKLADINVNGSGAEQMRTYAALAEAVFEKNTSSGTKSEIYYLQSAVADGDTEALTHLASMSKSYREGAVGLTALTVPTELARAHLALINAMMRMSQIIGDFARVNADPMTAMISLQQYVDAAKALGNALADIGEVYGDAGVVVPKGTPGSSFVHLYTDTMTRFRALQTP